MECLNAYESNGMLIDWKLSCCR